MRRTVTAGVAFGLSLLSQACDPGGTTGPQDIEKIEFAPALGVYLTQMTRTSSGLY